MLKSVVVVRIIIQIDAIFMDTLPLIQWHLQDKRASLFSACI